MKLALQGVPGTDKSVQGELSSACELTDLAMGRLRKYARAGLFASYGADRRGPLVLARPKPTSPSLRSSQRHASHLLIRLPVPTTDSVTEDRPRRTELCGQQQTRSVTRAMSRL